MKEGSIVIRKIEESKCDLYNCCGDLVGEINNYLSLVDARVQIRDRQLKGFYIIWKRQRLDITEDGRLTNWPEGFFDQGEVLLEKLLAPRIEHRRHNNA
jgi:hypothetical protein